MKPESYRIQPSCKNCGHSFVLYEYDEGLRYFCHIDKSERPRCGSIYMKEGWGCETAFKSEEERDAIFDKNLLAWSDWAEPKEVEPEGVCDKYEEESHD